MSSIVPGYEFDIFISYRQNDNQNGWVTQFVKSLNAELSSICKYPVSIYFDENPHSGLKKHHEVEGSLNEKLKCLLFIPILSQTYCDTKSFAWKYELLKFVELSHSDEYGPKIKLNDGNISSRILPIKIHNLDSADEALFESVTKSVIRSIDFIYMEQGVNRPLKVNDLRSENILNTEYNNQINKVAHAIKDLTSSIISPIKQSAPGSFAMELTQFQENNDLSIAVLPFVNMSNDPEQEYFSDGLTEEILTNLSQLKELRVISRSSSMTYKGTDKKIKEIGQELSVNYILEGSVRKAGNKIRITGQLIKCADDTHLWAQKYDSVMDDIFEIQDNVSKAIVEALKINLNSHEEKVFNKHHISNSKVYDLYLKAKNEIHSFTLKGFENALELITKAIEISEPNALLFGTIASVHYNLVNFGVNIEENLAKAEEWCGKTFQLDQESADANVVEGLLYLTIRGDVKTGVVYLKKALLNKPNDFDALFWLSVIYSCNGKAEIAKSLQSKGLAQDPFSPTFKYLIPAMIYYFAGNYEEALIYSEKGFKEEPNDFLETLHPLILANISKDQAIDFLRDKDFTFISILNIFQKGLFLALQNGSLMDIKEVFKDHLSLMKGDFSFAYNVSLYFCIAGHKKEGLYWLNISVKNGFCNFPLLNDPNEPINKLLKGIPDFDELLVKVKREWEDFN